MKVGVIYETVAVMFIDDDQSGQPATYCLNPQLTGAITNDIVVIANKFRRADDSGCDLLSVPRQDFLVYVGCSVALGDVI